MKINILALFILTAGLAALAGNASAQAPSVNIQFVNSTGGERLNSDIWVNFANGGAAVIAPGDGAVTYNASLSIGNAMINGTLTDIYTNTSYQLSTVENGMFAISSFGGGRGYVSYGAALTNYNPQMGPYAGWQPAPVTPDSNFTTRFQAFELTIQPNTIGSTGNFSFGNTNQTWADLSYIDQISISTAINAPAGATNPTQWSANTKALVDATKIYQPGAGSPTYSANSTNVITKAASGTQYYQITGTSSDYSNPGSTSIAVPAVTGNLSNFVRVAGPGQMPSSTQTGETAVYQSWTPYITALSPGGSLYNGTTSTSLTGSYGSAHAAALPYAGTATFNNGTVHIGNQTYTGYVLISNLTYNGTATDDIVIPFSSLTAPTGLYGTNPTYATGANGNYTLVVVPGNTLQTRVAGDLVAGMNFGFLGSSKTVTHNGTTQALGAFSSNDWWAIGTNDPTLLFSGAQPDNPFYNTYSAALTNLTSAYTFGIQDRLGKNTTQFDITGSGSTAVLQFIVQPDIAAVPEPATTWIMAGAACLLLAFNRRKKG